MTEAMEPPTRDREGVIMEEGERGPSPAGSRTLTPQPSAKSPTLSARGTARSKKSMVTVTVEDKQIL